MAGAEDLNEMEEEEKRNWYVVQVLGGKEEKLAQRCQKVLLPGEEEIFVPRYTRKRRIRGVWQDQRAVLFPGYLFAITDRVEELWYRLKEIPDLTKLLRTGDVFVPLELEEIRFLKDFGKKEHIVEVSMGYKSGDRIIITDGPLKDFQGKIARIDRHKRIAIIEVEFFGRITEVKVGLEVLSEPADSMFGKF